MKAVLIILCVILFTACASDDVESQAADLTFWAKCELPASPEMEKKIETFLTAKGFRVINLAAIQRAKDIHVFDLYIEAMDAKQRIIDFTSFPTNPGDYAIGLYSDPPTRHDDALEGMMMNFAAKGMGCPTRQINRGDNGTEARGMHRRNVLRIESLFKEADGLGMPNKSPNTDAPKDDAPLVNLWFPSCCVMRNTLS